MGVDDELKRAAASGVALVVILAAIPLLDRLIYWLGFLAGKIYSSAQKSIKGRIRTTRPE